VLAEFVRYHNRERLQRTLPLETPLPVIRSPTGTISPQPVLGSLHHTYEQVT
jgi:hypothetical protein